MTDRAKGQRRLALGSDGELTEDAIESNDLQADPMYCPNCGTANLSNAHFCRKCGTDLVDVDAQMVGLSSAGKARKTKNETYRSRRTLDLENRSPASLTIVRDVVTAASVVGMIALTQIFVEDGFTRVFLTVLAMIHWAGISALRGIFKINEDGTLPRLITDGLTAFMTVGMYSLVVIFNRGEGDTSIQFLGGGAILFFSIGVEALRRIFASGRR